MGPSDFAQRNRTHAEEVTQSRSLTVESIMDACMHSVRKPNGYCSTCRQLAYLKNQPIILCSSCQRWKRLYAKEQCQACYNRPTATRRNHPAWKKYCVICLRIFTQGSHIRCCSRDCASICTSLLCHTRRIGNCVKCGRFRLIRSRAMCNPCYVYSRLVLSKQGVGSCPRQVKDTTGMGI